MNFLAMKFRVWIVKFIKRNPDSGKYFVHLLHANVHPVLQRNHMKIQMILKNFGKKIKKQNQKLKNQLYKKKLQLGKKL